MKKFLSVTLIVLLTLFTSPIMSIVKADGMRIYPDPDGWKTYDENNQYAFISYKEGRQSMVLSIDYNTTDKESAWIFPVPADPNQVVIDNLDTLPEFYSGYEVIDSANEKIQQALTSSIGTQIYTYLFLALGSYRPMLDYGMVYSNSGESDISSLKAPSSVKVLEHLEKNGMVTEILSTKSATDLTEYLTEKGINIETKKISQLDEYIGKDFSFVVSWLSNLTIIGPVTDLSNIEKPDPTYIIPWINSIGRTGQISWPTVLYNMNQLGSKAVYDPIIKMYPEGIMTIYQDSSKKVNVIDYLEEVYFENVGIHTMNYGKSDVTFYGSSNNEYSPSNISSTTMRGIKISFPTEKLFFPLTLTSIYESKVIPAEIQVDGLVTPEVYKNISGMVETKYMSQSNYSSSVLGKDFFNPYQSSNTPYTVISINAPSKLLTQDLWINRSAPINITVAEKIANIGYLGVFLLGIFITILLSYFISIFTSLLIFKESRNKRKFWKYGLIGLFNLFSIIGLAIAMLFIPTKVLKEEDSELIETMKSKGYSTIAYRIVDPRKLLYLPVFSILFSLTSILLYLLVSN